MDSHLKQRLESIDMYLLFYGRVNRGVLVDHFNIGTATASRSLGEYISRWPENAKFIAGKAGGYFHSETFRPAFKHDANKALRLLCTGSFEQQLRNPTYGPQAQGFTRQLEPGIVAPITRAMVVNAAVRIVYISGSSGQGSRVVHPRSVFFGAGAWYYRAYDENHGEYRTFRFSRTFETVVTKSKETPSEDVEWSSEVVLSLAPHTRHSNPDAHAMDLGMADQSVSNITTNPVVAGFTLTDMRVDCSEHGSLDPFEYPLRLMNRDELETVASMAISPGYRLDIQRRTLFDKPSLQHR